jgi:hypothetical protein
MLNPALRIVVSIGLFAAIAVALVHAQDRPVRVRGAIEAVDGEIFVVKAKTGDQLKLTVAAGATVAAIVKASLADAKVGSYVGIATLPQADGTQKALEVLVFPESMRGVAEGHYAWDLQPSSMMTNGNVEQTVTAVDGQVLTVKYKDGEKKITIPAEAPIVTFAPADKSELKPGASIFVPGAQKQPDGTLQAARIFVGRGVVPPM